MIFWCVFGVFVLLFVFAAAPAAAAPLEASIDWTDKVVSDGRHNAFTDLVRWKGMYYLGFRKGDGHASLDGAIHILRSPDMRNWEPAAIIGTDNDDRDCHFCATEDRLFVYFGTWFVEERTDSGAIAKGGIVSHAASTTDGVEWTEPRPIYEQGFWMWRVREHEGVFYSAAYSAVRPTPDFRETRLLRSDDGYNWSYLSTVTKERMTGEADMVFYPDGAMGLLSRTGDKAGDAIWAVSDPEKREWTIVDTGTFVHSPAIAKWRGRYFVSGRSDRSCGTAIWELHDKEGRLEHLIDLPSGGDAAYPGLMVDPDTVDGDKPALFVSWYSQHEQEETGASSPADIFTARVVLR